jgi:hypothetical protein
MARGHDQLGGIFGIRRAEGAFFTRDAGIKLAVSGLHGEFVDFTLRNVIMHRHFRRSFVRGSNDEVSVGIRRWHFAIGQLFGRDVSGRVGIARRG